MSTSIWDKIGAALPYIWMAAGSFGEAFMLDFFRRYYKGIIWAMIVCFLLTLIPSVFFFVR